MPAQLFGQHPADGIERIGVHILAYVHHGIPHDAAVGHDHHQRRHRADRHQLQIADPQLRSLGSGHQRRIMGQAGKHLRRVADDVLHLMGAVGKILANAVRIIRCDHPALQQLIHVKTVSLRAGDTTCADVRLIQITQFFQIAHFIADGGGAQTHFVLLGNGTAAHGNRRQDVVVDDRLQDAELSCVHHHAVAASFHKVPFDRFLLALITIEC